MKIAPSTKTGSHHWILQRISALGLIPLVCWLVLSALKIVKDPDYISIFFAYPLNAILGIVFIAFSLFHGSLGMRVIIEDYVPNKIQKHFYIILINFLSIIAGVSAIISIIKLHMIG
jgi:succinate dehydrogenase / fumarate reductase membrane anchor subunit